MTEITPDKLINLLLLAPIAILSLSFHEAAHAWSANKLGDNTAKHLGRLTLDPMAHISLMGTIVVPMVSYLFFGFLFGAAKPVPVDERNFKNPVKDMALVAAAGPASNVLLAMLCAALLSFVLHNFASELTAESGKLGMVGAAIRMLSIGVQLNLMLCFFNLVPLPPLDGSRILKLLIPPIYRPSYEKLGQYSFFLLLLLVFSGAWRVIAVPIYFTQGLLFQLFNVPI